MKLKRVIFGKVSTGAMLGLYVWDGFVLFMYLQIKCIRLGFVMIIGNRCDLVSLCGG